MNDLREPLDDLLADVPAYVVPDARAAWAAGARRRTRHRVAVVACVAVVMALAAGLVTWLPTAVEPQPADGDGVGGYPARVLEPLVERELPLEPGPMAMVYRRNGNGVSGWSVADARGRTWSVPQEDLIDDYPPALSPDGRLLGYLATPDTYVIHDLVTGELNGLSIDQADDAPWFVAQQSPAFWSPDSRHLMVRVSGTADVAVFDPEFNLQQNVRSPGFPAGWVDDDTLAFVVDGTSREGTPPARLRLVGIDGELERTLPLDLPRRVATWLNQWSVSVSPDGTRLGAVAETGDLYELSTADGHVLRRHRVFGSESCSPSWQGDVPVASRTGTLVTASGEVVTDFDERLAAACAMAASGALAGERHVGLAQRWFGDGWLAFHARDVLTYALGGLTLVGVVLLLVRRNRRGRVHRLG